ncbi:MAG: hypothetical protein Q8Q12_11005 [bacterium]|nr:hypothetical protein [bacterium]
MKAKGAFRSGVLLGLFLVALLMHRCWAAELYSPDAKWNSRRGSLAEPSGVAVDSAGNVFVSDRGSHRIVKLSTSGEAVSGWGSYGKQDGKMNKPEDLAVDAAGKVFVCDCLNNRIQKFDASGKFLAKWGTYGFETPPEFGFPQGVAVDAKRNVYVADTGNHQLKVFDNSGKPLKVWGSLLKGDSFSQFNLPYDITVDSDGNIFVLDTRNNKVKKYDSTWSLDTEWGSKGFLDGQFEEPEGIAVDSKANVYVSDTGNHRIQKFDSQGKFLTEWGREGSGDGQFKNPKGIAVDSRRYVYVADTGNGRIQKFRSNASSLDTEQEKLPPKTKEDVRKTAGKLTVDNVVMLKELGTAEETILKKIMDTGTTLTAAEVAQLKKAGLSDNFIAKLSRKEEKKGKKEAPFASGLAGSWELRAAEIRGDLVLGEDGTFIWDYKSSDEEGNLVGDWDKVDNSTIGVTEKGSSTKSLFPCKLIDADTLQVTVEGVILQFKRKK